MGLILWNVKQNILEYACLTRYHEIINHHSETEHWLTILIFHASTLNHVLVLDTSTFDGGTLVFC